MKKGINNPGFRALPSSVQNNIISNMKYGGRKYNNGGGMRQLTEFNEGGRHEENGLGGIPQGVNPSGQVNLVEEGETKFDAENYIFSDTLKVDKELAKAFNLSPKMIGKTFADASKLAGRKKSRREGDAIEEAANNADLMNLMEAQEAFKQKEIEEKLAEIDALDPNALPAMMGQGQNPNMMQDPAMGGQIQEAPMMEQEAMMAQQGGPSPEEMAMMEQQMMGQQEGMMRSGGKIPKSVLLSRAKSHMSDAAAQEYVKNYGGGGYMSRSYQPGGFMGMGMNALPDPPDNITTTTNPPSDSSIFDPSTTDPNLQGMSDFLAQKMLSTQGAVASDAPVNVSTPTGSGGISFPSFGGLFKTKEERMNDKAIKQGKIDDYARDLSLVEEGDMSDETFFDKYSEKDRNYYSRKIKGPRIGTRRPIDTSNKWTWWSHHTSGDNRAGKKRYGPKLFESRRIKGMQFGGNLLDGGLQGQGIDVMQGLGSQMRRGGKLCYGCGGAMHTYGGRMNGISPNQAKYGKWLDLASNTLGTAASVIGNLPVIGTAIGAGLGTLSGVTGSLADNARASKDGKVDWKGIDYGDMALQAGMGAGSGALGFAGSTLTNLGGQGIDALTTSKYETQEAAHQDIINNPEKYSIEEYEAALAKEKERGKNSALFNIANKAIGIGGQMASGKIGKETTEEVIGEATDSAIDAIPVESMEDMQVAMPAFARYGSKLYGGGGYMGPNYLKSGGGLWANIHAKRKRIAAGSGERMRKKGEKGAPTEEAIKAAQKQMGGSLDQYTTDNTFETGGKLTLTKNVKQPDGTTIQKVVTYNSLEELLSDSEMVTKYGGENAVKELFKNYFTSVPATAVPEIVSNTAVDMAENYQVPTFAMQQPAAAQYTKESLQVDPEKLAEIEAVKNLERAVDTENPVFMPDPRMQEDSNINNIPDYLEMSGDFKQEEKETEKEIPVKSTEKSTDEKPEIPVDAEGIEDAKFDFKYKESFPQFASKMAGPLYNIGAGLLSKPKDYNPDFIPLDVPKFDPTQALNNVKRQVSGLRRQLNKVGANPSNLLALAQSGSRLENETLMTYDKLQKELDFRGEQYNKGQKQQLEKYKKQLEMSFDEAKRKSIQEGIKQFSELQQTEAANYLAAQYNAMAAPNLGTFEYVPFLEGLLNRENKKKKKK